MALSSPRALYGIHSVTPYNTSTGIYYGIFRVLQGSTFTMSGEINELRGGSNRFPWVNEDGNISADLNINCSEYPDFLFELFLGQAPTSLGAEASGNVSNLTDKNGTSVVDAAGFLTTITVSTAADLKFGKYLLKATGTTTAELYKSTNIDDERGTDATEFSDALLVESLTSIGSGSTHAITAHGITLTAGASAGGMTSGDTATFEVRPVSTGTLGMTATFGGLADVFPQFGALLYSAQRGNGEMFEIDVFKVKSIGCTLGSAEKSYSSWNVTGKAAYDSDRTGLFSVRFVQP